MAASPSGALAARLAPAIGRLRRSLNRLTRAGTRRPPIAEAQLEVLRLVERHPSIRVQEVAATLGVAPNTVSTLVHQLIGSALMTRQPDAADGRVARLRLTPGGQDRLRRWRDLRHEILASRLDRLSVEDREALDAAVPALVRLTEALDAGPGTAPRRGSRDEVAAGAG